MTYAAEAYEAGYARGTSDKARGVQAYLKPDGTKYVAGYLAGWGKK